MKLIVIFLMGVSLAHGQPIDLFDGKSKVERPNILWIVAEDMSPTLGCYGDPDAVIFPRSSCKILQALPLMRSGAAKRARLTSEQLALACASHQGAAIHTDRVDRWLKDLGLGNDLTAQA